MKLYHTGNKEIRIPDIHIGDTVNYRYIQKMTRFSL